MRRKSKLFMCGLAAWLVGRLWAQDLSPRAYVITPNHSNAVVLTWSYINGGIDLNGAIPISGVTATGIFSVPSFSYYHSFGIYGHSANVTFTLPYGVGNFHGEAGQLSASVYRSGLMDVVTRVSVNLVGGPVLPLRDFVKWRQKVLLGASLKIVAPSGQYSSQKLINWGINRWAFKPELGYSERWGNWILDAYAGAWFYTENPAYFARPLPRTQTEGPIGSFEGHISRNFGPGTWASIDGNFWWGGVTSLNGIRNPATKQTNSRLGATVAWRFAQRQSVKVSYSDGTYIRFGGNYNMLQVGWQYSWIGWPGREKFARLTGP